MYLVHLCCGGGGDVCEHYQKKKGRGTYLIHHPARCHTSHLLPDIVIVVVAVVVTAVLLGVMLVVVVVWWWLWLIGCGSYCVVADKFLIGALHRDVFGYVSQAHLAQWLSAARWSCDLI